MRNPETGYPQVRRAAIVGTLFVQTLFVQSLLVLMAGPAVAQANEPAPSVQVTAAEQSPPQNSAAASPPTITFSDALQRATANNPQLQAAFTALGLAHQDLVQSRAALLPNINYNMQFLYTEPSPHGTNNPIFIANNGVHEYSAQGNVHQALSLQTFADYGRASAAQAVAKAKTTDAKKVAETIKGARWDTVLGPISYDKKGDITTVDYVFYKWGKDGKYDEIPAGKGS